MKKPQIDNNPDEIEFSKSVRQAIRSGDVPTVVSLLEAHPDWINLVTTFGTWLHLAAREGNLDMVRALVKLGVDIDLPGGTFETGPIILATSYGHAEIVRFFLDSGAKKDVSEPFRNPVFSAIYNGHLDIVKLLIAHGFDPKVRYFSENMKGASASDNARALGRNEIADYLESLE